MENNKIKVYARLDSNNCVIEIASSIQPIDFTAWIEIDEGTGDKYAHAQGNYFDVKNGEKPLIDNQGRCNYKYIDSKVMELTDEEKETLFPVVKPQPSAQEELINTLIVDNINMQIQIDSLIESSLGGN